MQGSWSGWELERVGGPSCVGRAGLCGSRLNLRVSGVRIGERSQGVVNEISGLKEEKWVTKVTALCKTGDVCDRTQANSPACGKERN